MYFNQESREITDFCKNAKRNYSFAEQTDTVLGKPTFNQFYYFDDDDDDDDDFDDDFDDDDDDFDDDFDDEDDIIWSSL